MLKRNGIIFISVVLTIVLLAFFPGIGLYGQEVTPSGAFTYSYPIEVPPGTNGMGPELSLIYNSHGATVFWVWAGLWGGSR